MGGCEMQFDTDAMISVPNDTSSTITAVRWQALYY